VTRHRELAAAVVLLGLGLAAAREARRLAVGDLGRPGEGFFPFLIAVALALAAAGLVARALAGPVRPAGPAPGPVARPRAVWTLLAAAGYAFALEPLGFVAATLLLLLFLFRVMQPWRWAAALGASAGIAVASHLLFKVWLGVRLPAGPWGF